MNQPTNQSAVLLIGHGSRNKQATEEYRQLAQMLGQRLARHVEPCFLEFADPPIIDGFRACVELGVSEIIALPLFIGPAGHQKNDVPAVINWAKIEWPHLRIRYGTPLGAQYHLVSVLADRLAETVHAAKTEVDPADTAVIVMGRGSRDPDSNSDVAKLARLLYEGRDYGWVEPAYFSLTTPRLPDVIARMTKLGAKRVIVLPHLLFTGKIHEKAVEQAAQAGLDCNVEVLTSSYLFPHPDVIEAIVHRFEQATDGTAAMTCDLCKYRNKFDGFESEFGLPQTSDTSHGLRGVPHSHGMGSIDIEAQIEALLPPRYKNGTSADASPMPAADLKYNADGDVAWGDMWEDFCDLALAGGPAHRDALLEPVDPALIKLNPSGYATTLDELKRGLALVTNLPVVKSKSPGWIGITCDSEEMAIWLLRAIVVENVFARREGTTLLLPAGPHFQLSDQIKSIITVVAKTNHYWQEHIAAQGSMK